MRLATTSRIAREYAGLTNRLPDCRSLSHASSSAAANIWIVSGVKAVSRRKNSGISTIFSLTQRTREHCCIEGETPSLAGTTCLGKRRQRDYSIKLSSNRAIGKK
jgi:hypothetical protein